MTNLYPFIQDLLEWPFNELVSSDISLWNQYKYVAFNIFACRILIISYKTLIIIYRQKLASLLQVHEKLKTCRNSKWNFSSSCFIAGDSRVKIVWLHVVIPSEHDILHFRYVVHLLKYCPVKASQNSFYSFNCSNQTGMQVSKFSFAQDK